MWSNIVSWKHKYFSEKLRSYDCVLPLLVQKKETFGRLQLEAHRAYKCKQILGLCQADRP
jgi:hypothetical protein